MYSPGRDVPHPTPDKPVYYFPVVTGYSERGAKLAGTGETPPPKKTMVHDLAIALAAQGYRVTQEIEVPAKAGTTARAGETPPATVKALSPPPVAAPGFQLGIVATGETRSRRRLHLEQPAAGPESKSDDRPDGREELRQHRRLRHPDRGNLGRRPGRSLFRDGVGVRFRGLQPEPQKGFVVGDEDESPRRRLSRWPR